MIDAIVMPILKCILSLFLWVFLGGAIGLGVHYLHGVDELDFRASTLHLMDLEDWGWVTSLIAIIGMFTIFGIILNLKL